ncbi:MAG: general secretion pathway protein GspB [Pseudomonadota bacterium]
MSMILDALSRAERERRHEQHQELDAGRYVPSSTIKEDRFKKWVFIALLLNFVLIIAILLVYLWRTDAFVTTVSNESNTSNSELIENSIQSTPAPSQKISQIPSTPSSAQNVKNLTPPQTDNSSLLSEAQVAKKNVQAAIKPTMTPKTTVPPVSYSPKPLEQPKKPSIPVEDLLAVEPSNTSQSYLLLTDLSPSQRTKLNKYEVNVHVFDENTQNSFVLINMTKFKTGDRLPGGQEYISAIVPEGVVIDFGGGKVLIERN